MSLVTTVRRHGKKGLEVKILAMPYSIVQRLISDPKNNSPISLRKLGVTNTFVNELWRQANAMPIRFLKTKHRDSYQYDPAEKSLFHEGRVYRDGDVIHMDDKLHVLALNIVENTLEIEGSDGFVCHDIVSEALRSEDGLSHERAVTYLHNWLYVMTAVKFMKQVFENLLQRKLRTLVNVWFDKDTAKKYHAFINGSAMEIKGRLQRMLLDLRRIEMDILGADHADDAG